MRISADLGCLQESTMLPRHILDGNTTVRWSEKYVLSPIQVDTPESGVTHQELACPVCGGGLKLRLVSVQRIHFLLCCVLLVITVVIAGVATVLFAFAGAQDEVLRIVGLVGFGLAALSLIGTFVVASISPNWLARSDDVFSIARDDTRESQTGEGFSGMQGHKLFNVRPE